MRCDVPVWFELVLLVLVKILVQNLNDWQWCLVVLAQGDIVGDALTVILKDTIKVHKAEEEQVRIAPHVLHDVEEAVEHVFCDFFFLSKVKDIRLIIISRAQHLSHSFKAKK
jgi:hypothetical protein